MTPQRQRLAEAITVHSQWAAHCDKIDAELAAKEGDQLKRAGEERQRAEESVKQARLHSPTPEKRALSAVLGTDQPPTQTVAEAEAALDALQAKHDSAYGQISAAKREAWRIRSVELVAAEKQRDDALGTILETEGLIADLLDRYANTRRELGRLYCALSALPLNNRPGGIWQSPVSLHELQQGDTSLANEVRDVVAALGEDASAPLPGSPLPTTPAPVPAPLIHRPRAA
jgi:hypothetical protein